jgi:hypothetical protein
MTGLTLPLLFLGGAAAASVSLPVQLETRSALNSRLANVHLSVSRSVEGPVTVSYGSCTSSSLQDAHHVLGDFHGCKSDSTRLVWVLPEDTESGGCLSAWTSAGALVGRSEPQLVENIQKRGARKRAGRNSPLDESQATALTQSHLTSQNPDGQLHWHRCPWSMV